MADVFVAFVREDQPFAEAIAITLQDAGLTVSRSASVMEAIDASPAVVVLWTPASSRSRLFLDAADRAFRSGKMVLARLGGAPTPAEYAAALTHNFQSWSGDPDHTELTVIVGHVMRMVEFARGRASGAGYGGGTVQPFPAHQRPAPAPPAYSPPYTPPAYSPPPYAPAPAPAPSLAPSLAPGPSGPEARLVEEAAFWRHVQANGAAGDYRAYLDRYGPNGQFSEVASLRLQQLTAPPPPPQPAARPAPPPASRFEPERFEPDRNPAHRGAERPAPLPRRGLDLERPPERSYREYETPPTPKSGAGIGAFLFLLILGGLAAGGWFIYNGGSFLPIGSSEERGKAGFEDVGPAARAPIQPIDQKGTIATDAPPAAPDPGPRSGGDGASQGAPAPTGTPKPPPAAASPPKSAPPKSPPAKAAPAKTASAPAEPEIDLNALERDRLARTPAPAPEL